MNTHIARPCGAPCRDGPIIARCDTCRIPILLKNCTDEELFDRLAAQGWQVEKAWYGGHEYFCPTCRRAKVPQEASNKTKQVVDRLFTRGAETEGLN